MLLLWEKQQHLMDRDVSGSFWSQQLFFYVQEESIFLWKPYQSCLHQGTPFFRSHRTKVFSLRAGKMGKSPVFHFGLHRTSSLHSCSSGLRTVDCISLGFLFLLIHLRSLSGLYIVARIWWSIAGDISWWWQCDSFPRWICLGHNCGFCEWWSPRGTLLRGRLVSDNNWSSDGVPLDASNRQYPKDGCRKNSCSEAYGHQN